MRRRDQWSEWIKAVERESETAALALELLAGELRRDPSVLKYRGLARRDFVESAQNREMTYLVRLFAVFENGLREAWMNAFGQTSHPRTADLLEAIATRRKLPDKYRSNVHRVRIYRNSIVHDDSEPSDATSIKEARKSLCQFFGFLPAHW